ncbi:hypothetical protein [Gardnerella vaginalis]|uniref:hypothetical protein n=1 Tax=Gardnerella vaginalis TaxID=2702 RepID=UPI00197AB8CF|nr:hypothetical protein [Gardnerella vaginalis]
MLPSGLTMRIPVPSPDKRMVALLIGRNPSGMCSNALTHEPPDFIHPLPFTVTMLPARAIRITCPSFSPHGTCIVMLLISPSCSVGVIDGLDAGLGVCVVGACVP